MDSSPGEPDARGRMLDVFDSGDAAEEAPSHAGADDRGRGRVWIGVYYECCETYARVYRRPADVEYRGRCPSCGSAITIRVGPNGVNSRFLIATPVIGL